MRRQPDPQSQGQTERSAWLAGCRAGNRDAIAQMFQENCTAVERMISRLVGATPDLEDLVQTTFIEAMRTIGKYRGEASFKTWITSIAVHIAQHHLRAGRLRRHASLETVPEDRIASEPPPIEAILDQRQLSVRLYALLDRLPAYQRVALLLFTLEGKSVEEVAALMGASQTATRSRVFFARRAMRALIRTDAELTELAHFLFGGKRGLAW